MPILTKKIIRQIFSEERPKGDERFKEPDTLIDGITQGMIAAISGRKAVLRKYFAPSDRTATSSWKNKPRFNIVCFAAGATESCPGCWSGMYKRNIELVS